MPRAQGLAASPVHTQSTPTLPQAAASPVSTRDDRRTLANSISATLLPQESNVTSEESGFRITDLITLSSTRQPRQIRKRSQPGAAPYASTDNATLAPLSPVMQPFVSSKRNQPDSAGAQYLGRLDRPENTELFTYASALCHRITGRYLSRELLQRDPEAQKREIARIQKDPELLHAISVVRTLSKEFKEIARDTMGHRKELGLALLRIEESYLKLFEKLLGLALRMYWKYEQANEDERARDKQSIAYWQEMHSWKAGEATKLQRVLEGKEIVVKTQQIQLEDLERQCVEMQRELSDQRQLERQVFELQETERQLRDKERVLQADYDKLQRKHEEMLLYERERLEDTHEQHKRMVDEMKRSLRDKEQQLTRHERAIRELTTQATPPEKADADTQTVVDDDGLWDAQDGVPRCVSKELSHRLAWRRFNAYVTCKNCRGKPLNQQSRLALQRDLGSAETDQDYVDVWSLPRHERKTKTKKTAKRYEAMATEWRLPDAVLLFLSNLPRSVVAFPLYSLEHVVQQIEQIYDDKFESDKADEADGVAREEMPSFICEFFLKSHGLRQSAEIGLYRFLISVKNHYQKHSHVHLFARFCDFVSGDATTTDATEATASAGAGTLLEVLLSSPRRSYLDRSYLHVFLHARHFLQRPPPLKPGRKPTVGPQDHLLEVEKLKKWVPLDHAVSITRWYVSFLPEDAVISYCREVEYSTAIYAGKAITEISGNRLAVRAEMRKAMLTSGGELEQQAGAVLSEKERRRQPRIVADVHRVLLLLTHALEQRRGVMEKALITMFDAGDVNHDCVLSLDEFKTIIRSRVASFSDRRILRMFREALMSGSDQSFALSMDAFVKVCNDHGLVTLLPDDRWQDPFHKAIEAAAVMNISTLKATNKLTAALKAMASQKASLAREEEEAKKTNSPTAPGIVPEETDEVPEDLVSEATTSMDVLSPRAEEVDEDAGLWQW